MNYLGLGFKALRLWPQIQQLITLLKPLISMLPALIGAIKPVIQEMKLIAPKAMPLIRQLAEELSPELAKQLKEGGKDFDVKWLQDSLKKLGYKVTVDGDYGPATKAAVTEFQKDHDLDPDGWAGVQTSAAIYNALAER